MSKFQVFSSLIWIVADDVLRGLYEEKELVMVHLKKNQCNLIRLFVIDDHYLIIEGLYSSFDLESDEFKVVGSSLNIGDALKQVVPDNTDIIILDLVIGQSDPVQNLQQIRKAFPSIPVVILSHESCLVWQNEMFRHGVKAFINKSEPKSVLKQKLLRVYAGELVIPEEVVQILFMPGDKKQMDYFFSDFKEIITDLSEGMTVKEIAQKMHQTESSIEKKLQNIRKAYHARTNTELVFKTMINPVTA